MTTRYRFTLGAHTVVDRFRHFGRQVDLLNSHIDNFNTQRRHTVRVDDRNFALRLSRYALCRFGNGVICRRGSNFIFCTRRTGVQRVTYFEGQTTTGIGDDVFHVQTTNFRTQTVRELTFQQHFRLRNVATARCQVVTAEIADTPFDVRVDDQVFLLFGHKAVGLVVHGLNTCVEHFHRFNERYLEMQTRLINQRFVVIVTQYLTKTQRNTALTFFDDKDRHVKHYQHDDDNRDN